MKKKQKKHTPLQGSVRGYIREISVAMFLQIQTDIYFYLFSRATLNETFMAKYDGVLPRTP